MYVSKLTLKNWRNFRHANVRLGWRQFLVGPNASGKSNFLDVFRFLRDMAKKRGGGLQEAIQRRGGLSRIRCLNARKDPEVSIGVEIAASDARPRWRYEIGLRQESRGFRRQYISFERVWDRDRQILARPNEQDEMDAERLEETYLEQVNNNEAFRGLRQFFEDIRYAHLVPQLIRHADEIQGRVVEDDPFGQGFLQTVAGTPSRTRKSRFTRINKVLKAAVPQLRDLQFERDETTGRPHLAGRYEHWRPNAGRQRENQFSDGTLRLIALLWSLLEGDAPLLLEEPELSLHTGVVEQLPSLLHRAGRKRRRQILVSTHSSDLLSDPGIGGEEVLLLSPGAEGTAVTVSSDERDVRLVLEAGASVGEAVVARTRPVGLRQGLLPF